MKRVFILLVILALCVCVFFLLLSPKAAYPCGENLPSYVGGYKQAVVTSLPQGNYLPLYSEPLRTGGTNGGLVNGTVVQVLDGPVCSDGGVWWMVSGTDAFGKTSHGWVHEVIFTVDFDGRLQFKRLLVPD